ncbi:hypothetical protein FACS1894170_11660 [Planctomycetales bacterium]|nr:hypothetical protein FACS1894170_11660 [Planctomycetales bacterium]
MKTLTNFAVAAFIACGTILTANAEVVVLQTEHELNAYGTFSSNLSEKNSDSLQGGWTVASLFTYTTNGTTSQNKQYEAYASKVLNQFQNGEDLRGNGIQYGSVKQIAAKDLTTTNGAGKHLDWLTPNAGTNASGEGLNGFYAFNYKFDFAVIDEIDNYDNLNVIINLAFGADDHIEGVYLNGKSVSEYLSGYGTENWSEAALLREVFDASELAADGGIFAKGNELVFIVHNDGHNGQATGFRNGSNAFGFGGDGYIALSADRNYAPGEPVPPATSTPEPATMLIIGLGIAGLGLARRRK